MISVSELRDEFESSTSPLATLAGSVIGPFLVLAAVTSLGFEAGRWLPWASLALGVIVLIATLYTIYEGLCALLLYQRSVSKASAIYVLASKILELTFFAAASFLLLRSRH